jgi:hypothetical protein
MFVPLIGNCFCWAYILKFIYGGEVFSVSQEPFFKGRNVRHYMLRDRNGKIRHFKRVFNFLPPPFCNFIFICKLEISGKIKKKR